MMVKLREKINLILSRHSNCSKAPFRGSKPSGLPSLVYVLESPQLQFLKLNAVNHFRGFVLDLKDRAICGIEAYHDGESLGCFGATGSSRDIAEHVPHMANAHNCRFDFDQYVDGDASRYRFEVIYVDGSKALAFEYHVAEVCLFQTWLRQMVRRLADLPSPPAELVYLTQGVRDTEAYQNSIIPGIYNAKRYLRNAGVNTDSVHSVLDFGCGTGRLLIGWYLDNPERHLFGCDINTRLLAWASDNLPDPIQWFENSLHPPLPCSSNAFDLVYLVSVFTHLSSELQDLWRKELERIVKPGGYVLMTLQGEVYVRLFHPQRAEEFSKTGYIETAAFEQGSNAFGAYHSFEAVDCAFDGFEIIGYYPMGWINYPEVTFPIAAFQDVYVLRRHHGRSRELITRRHTKATKRSCSRKPRRGRLFRHAI
jgi:SAM-dependent methyltransferase